MTKKDTNRLLGYPADSRLLIVNADDFGMCHSVNQAVIQAFTDGIVSSTTLMVPCPWALHAMHFLDQNPEVHFGIHLTVISDWEYYKWGPLLPSQEVPSLIYKAGYFYNFDHMTDFFAYVDLGELEKEFRAQIEFVLSAGLSPTHLDWHSLRIGAREDIFDLMFGLAREYGLALRVMGRSRIEKVQSQGLPTNDYDFLDSYLVEPARKSSSLEQMLRDLPEGLSEWAVHPGLDSPELLAIEITGNHERQLDYNFLVSQTAKDIIEEEGIILLDYQPLQALWKSER